MNRFIQPEIHPLKILSLKKPLSFCFRNGVKVSCIPVSDIQLVRFDFMFKGGQWIQDMPLQTRFAFRQLKEGTSKYDSDSIAEKLDLYGASIEIATNISFSCVTVYCLKKHVQNVLEIVWSMFAEPLYAQEKLDIALSQAKLSYEVSCQTVSSQAKQLIYKSLYGPRHPMALFPKPEDYDLLKSSHLFSFKEKYITSHNCQIFITGGYDDATVRYVEELFGVTFWGAKQEECETGVFELKRFDSTIDVPKERLYHKMDKPTVQSAIRIGCKLDMLGNDTLCSLRVVNTILGGYFGSRLMAVVREAKGYTYDINSALYQIPYNTTFIVSTETPKENVDDTINEVHKEIKRLQEEPIDEKELEQVKNYMIGALSRSCEFGFNLPILLMRFASYGKKLDDVISDYNTIRDISPKEIMRHSVSLLRSESMVECIAE